MNNNTKRKQKHTNVNNNNNEKKSSYDLDHEIIEICCVCEHYDFVRR